MMAKTINIAENIVPKVVHACHAHGRAVPPMSDVLAIIVSTSASDAPQHASGATAAAASFASRASGDPTDTLVIAAHADAMFKHPSSQMGSFPWAGNSSCSSSNSCAATPGVSMAWHSGKRAPISSGADDAASPRLANASDTADRHCSEPPTRGSDRADATTSL